MFEMKYFWIILSVIRIGLLLTPFCQNWSYIQPDQFFQSTEPIAGDIFDTEVLLVWEFNSSFPLRNIFLPQLISRPVFTLLKITNLSDSPFLVFIGPRIVITLLSFLCDYSLYKLCELSDRSASVMASLIVFSSSYITTTYLTQTFSNSIETILVSLLLVNVFKSIANNYYNPYNSFIIGSILAFGFFNRPTFVLFAFGPLLFWALSHGYGNEERKASQLLKQLISRGLSLLTPFMISSMSLIIVDTLYYTKNCFEIYENLVNYRFEEFIKSLVITPLNFAIYNTKTSNLANHGLHPPYFHMLVSVPMAFSLLGLFAYLDFFQKSKQSIKLLFKQKTNKPVITVFQGICLMTFIIPLLGFSLIPHQEPRFLIPSLVPLCYLYANRLISRKSLFFVWIALNTILTIFYGFIHQSKVIEGVIDLSQIIDRSGQKQTDIVFSNHYLPPRHLLNIPKNSTNIRIHDLSVLEFPESLDTKLIELKIQNITDFYLMIPSCLTEQLNALFTRHEIQEYKLVKQYFPYFTGEDIRSSIQLLTTSFDSIQMAFSLNIWKVFIK